MILDNERSIVGKLNLEDEINKSKQREKQEWRDGVEKKRDGWRLQWMLKCIWCFLFLLKIRVEESKLQNH